MLIFKYRIQLILFVIIVALVSGCNKEREILNTEEIKTVDWYLSHREEMNKQMEKCISNPGKYDSTANCINAKAASLQSQTGTIHKVPF